jgi:hypothetical protein
MNDSTTKKILDSALTALLKGLELSPWVKVPAEFVRELSKRFSQLQPEEKQELANAQQNAISNSLSLITVPESAPKPEKLAEAVQAAVRRSRLLDYLYGLNAPALNELISRIDDARENVSDIAPRRSQVAQLIDWVESSEGPGLSKLAGVIGTGF